MVPICIRACQLCEELKRKLRLNQRLHVGMVTKRHQPRNLNKKQFTSKKKTNLD
ncbi:hypothetical protein T11_14348 [Trichinella zimbabwensis]|uniref:Uncharacterized protein n=1 Tax=Trichinella zimbabwensis TaxID=268475 RepID=A0A0V1GKI1_9BILA|nr:hypothetical protein T11_14348 [Trichinella zimbabwensis]